MGVNGNNNPTISPEKFMQALLYNIILPYIKFGLTIKQSGPFHE